MSYRALVAVPGLASAAAARDAFSRAGFETVAVTNFQDALDELRHSCPDLLATAMRLGDFNGVHLTIRAHALYPDLPVMILGREGDSRADAEGFGATFVAVTGDEIVMETATGLLQGRPER
jgi:DNA-binding response OmpR family regulator